MTTAVSDDRVRYRLDIAYDGTAFHGWGTQPGLRTVQGTLEAALGTLFSRYGSPPRLVVAGRTDAGVHATGQVAHCDLEIPQSQAVDPETLLCRLARIVGDSSDVVVRSVSHAPDGFDARFSALWRRYEYRLVDRAGLRDPLTRHSVTWHSRPLDENAMNEVAAELLGLHDFGAFCKAREEATTIRTLQGFSWSRRSDGVLVCDVKADAFCHNMVRSLVGACVAVGEGKLSSSEVVRLRDARMRTSSFRVMPARGLTLIEVGYPDDGDHAARAMVTRAKRTANCSGDDL